MNEYRPPEYMPPSKFKCEGYWGKGYKPTISKENWNGKQEWVNRAIFVEKYTPIRSFRGISFSRIDGSPVGNKEYYDVTNNICWPEGYVQHYILNNNVMPTERFFNYINYRYILLLYIYMSLL